MTNHCPKPLIDYSSDISEIGLIIRQDGFAVDGAFLEAANQTSVNRVKLLGAIIEETGDASGRIILQGISGLKRVDARAFMKEFLQMGGTPLDIAHWLQAAGSVLRRHKIKPSNTASIVIDTIKDGTEWLVNQFEDAVDGIVEGIETIIDAAIDGGVYLTQVLKRVASWTVAKMADLLQALLEKGIKFADFAAGTFKWTYSTVISFVEAALMVGYRVADLMEAVVKESYWALRRYVNGILANAGFVGEIFDYILTQAEGYADKIWHKTLLAARYADALLEDVLNWMADQTIEAFEGVIGAWESIGEDLIDLYSWASQIGDEAWEIIGSATVKLKNSAYYAYNYLATSGKDCIFAFSRGMLKAGFAIAGPIGWAVEQSVEICAEVIKAGLETGFTLAVMLVEIAADPRRALDTYMEAMREIGKNLQDLFHDAIVGTTEEFRQQLLTAMFKLEVAVEEMLIATLSLAAAAVTILISSLLNYLGSYRPMRPEEIADAKSVFGNGLNYNFIFLSTEDPLNKILFAVQDFLTGKDESRAFMTTNLINFDVSDGPIDRPTLIHELTHVWQNEQVGGIYFAEAILAQQTTEEYNYGYLDQKLTPDESYDIQEYYSGEWKNKRNLGKALGLNGEAALDAENGDFGSFNREQQGQILMHWFVRTQLEIRDANGVAVNEDASSWEPYQQAVFQA